MSRNKAPSAQMPRGSAAPAVAVRALPRGLRGRRPRSPLGSSGSANPRGRTSNRPLRPMTTPDPAGTGARGQGLLLARDPPTSARAPDRRCRSGALRPAGHRKPRGVRPPGSRRDDVAVHRRVSKSRKRHRAAKPPLTEPARRSVQISPCLSIRSGGRTVLAPLVGRSPRPSVGDRVSRSTHLSQRSTARL